MKKRVQIMIAIGIVSAFLIMPVLAFAQADQGAAAVQSSGGASNYMTDEQYREFGFTLIDPEDFNDKAGHPLDGYQRMTLSELYIGRMNRYDAFDGSFQVAQNVQSLSGGTLNIDNMRQSQIGKETAFKYGTPSTRNKETMEYQLHNAVGIDHDGDGVDIILDNTLYTGMYGSSQGRRNMQRIALYSSGGGSYTEAATELLIPLTDSTTSDPASIWGIRQNSANCYTAMTAGDFDEDGKEEAAIYVPFNSKNKTAYIAIVKAQDGALSVVQEIPLKDLGKSVSGSNGSAQFASEFTGWSFPIVQLSTTQISGRDELVINACLARKSSGDGYANRDQKPVMSIYSWNGASAGKEVFFYNADWGSYRMRFASTADADLNGNGVKELVLGGYKNRNASGNAMGDIDGGVNLLQLFTYENGKYLPVWDTPKEVPALSGLDVGNIELEPAALAAGRFYNDGQGWGVFLEGKVFRYTGYAQTAASEAASFKNSGQFTEYASMKLGGDNHPWIASAVASCFSAGNLDTDQIVIQSGDKYKDKDKEIFYDISWMWNSGGTLVNEMTNNNWVSQRSLSDDGTFLTLCALDADKDTSYFQLQEKIYGWGKPTPVAITLSTPYWEDLDYDGDDDVTFGRGRTSFSITSSQEEGDTDSWKVGGGANFSVEQMLGTDIGVAEAMGGFSLDLEGIGLHVHDYYESQNITTGLTYNNPGGQDGVVMMASPLVSYYYKVIVPEYTVTAEYRQAYQDKYGAACPYAVGETIYDQSYDCSVDNQYGPTYHLLSLDRYNQLAQKYASEGVVPIDANAVMPHALGDPTTYPVSTTGIAGVNDGKLYVSDYPVTIDPGRETIAVTLGIAHTEETTDGSEGTFDLAFDAQFKTAVGWGIKHESQLGGGINFETGGGRTHTTSNMSGSEFEAELVKLPEVDGADQYQYGAQMAVWRTTLTGTDKNGNAVEEKPTVIGFIVTGANRNTSPPSLPGNPRVYATTESAVTLAWDDVDTTGRPADEYGIWVADQYGNFINEIARVPATQNFFVDEGLAAGTAYTYKLKAYGPGGSNPSALSREIKAITLEANAPVIDTQPQSQTVAEGNVATFSVAAHSQNGRELKYQWQEFVTTAGSYMGSWKNIAGATGASYATAPATAAMNGGKYRVEVYENGHASGYVAANYSNIATLTVGTEAPPDIILTVETAGGGEARPAQDEMIINIGDTLELTAQMALSSPPTPPNNIIDFYIYGSDGTPVVVSAGNPAYDGTTATWTATWAAGAQDSYQIVAAVRGSITTMSALDAPVEAEDTLGKEGAHPPAGADMEEPAPEEPDSGNGTAPERPDGATETGAQDGLWQQQEYPAEPAQAQEQGVSADMAAAQATTEESAAPVDDAGTSEDPETDDASEAGKAAAQPQAVGTQAAYSPPATAAFVVNAGQVDQYRHARLLQYLLNADISLNNPANIRILANWAPDTPLQPAYRPGAIFRGWYLDENLSQRVQSLSHACLNGQTALFADWEFIEYQITYELDGGKNDPTNPSTKTVVSPSFALRDPVKAGYAFLGWFSDAQFTKRVAHVNPGGIGNLTLHAKWEMETYHIFYNTFGGTNPASNPSTYMVHDAVALQAPQYSPGAWFSAYDYTRQVSAIPVGTTGDIVLYGKRLDEGGASPTEPDAETNRHGNAAKTGDESSLGLWVALCAAAGSGLVAVIVLKRKRGKQ